MVRFILRRLLWAIPTLFIVTFLVYVAIRIGTDPLRELPARQPTGVREEDPAVHRDQRALRRAWRYVRGYFKWLRRFVSGDWPRTHQGQPRGVAEPEGGDGQLDPSRRPRHDRRHHDRSGDRRLRRAPPRQPAATRPSTPAAFFGLSIPPYVSAVLFQLIFAVYWSRWYRRAAAPDVGRLPDRDTVASTSWLMAQAHGAAGDRRGDPDDRRLRAVHAGLAARRPEQRVHAHRARRRASASGGCSSATPCATR